MRTYQAVSSTGQIHVLQSRQPLRLCVIGANKIKRGKNRGEFAFFYISRHRSEKQATRAAKSLTWRLFDCVEILSLEEIPNV